MRVYGYIRCATENPASIIAQRDAIEAFCSSLDVSLTELFVDAPVPSYQPFSERPGGDSLLRVAKRSDMVVVSGFDRLSRNAADLALLLAALHQRGLMVQVAYDRAD
jgi:DNA invertase Pin-like site-specific DNA recombinase